MFLCRHTPVRAGQQVAYRLPAFGALTVEVATNTTEAGEADRTGEIAANYDSGPLHLGAGYQKTGDRNQFALRGLYELGASRSAGTCSATRTSMAAAAAPRCAWRACTRWATPSCT